MQHNIVVIIPAYNEENAVGKVLDDLPMHMIREVVVVNNNSKDDTRQKAIDHGATVLDETRQGYGQACLKGMDYARQMQPQPAIIVFLDADYSDHPEELPLLCQPIIEEGYDMVIGTRVGKKRQPGAMLPQQLFGNWLATGLMKLLHGFRYSDLGPFRGIRWSALEGLKMKDTTYGWTVEMQLKAAKHKLKIKEVPVSYRVRIGTSKISGTVKGTVLAGYKIITTIFKYL